MKSSTHKSSRSGFTLVELIISLGIISALSTIAVLTINPNQTFKQTRDTNRISDMQTLNNALLHYQVAGGSGLGSTNTIYISLPSDQSNCSDLALPTPPVGWSYACKSSATFRNVDGTGWIPVNFSVAQESIGKIFSALPVDPLNTLTGDLYYTYIHGTDWAVSATMESVKNLANIAMYDGGSSDTRFEVGKDINLNSNLAGAELSSAKDITSFGFDSSGETGVIVGTDINVNVSVGTNVTALVPTIGISANASVSPLSGAAQNFTSPVTYTVTAEDSTTQNYFVTVNPVIGIMTNYGGTGTGPVGIAFDGTNMWTANGDGYSVTKISPAGAMQNYGTGPWPTMPYSIAFDGTNMWTANMYDSSVTKITLAGATTTYLGVGGQPYDIAYNSQSGDLWTANWGDINGSVTKINKLTGAMQNYTRDIGPNPYLGAYAFRAIAFNHITGDMWTANSDASVTKISPAGVMTNFAGIGVSGSYPDGQAPFDIAFDGTNMWTVNFPDTVSKISPAGVITNYPWPGNGVGGIAFDGTNMWTTNNNDNSVTRISPSGIMTTYSGDLGYPYGIAFDGTNMWITSSSYNRVTKIRAK